MEKKYKKQRNLDFSKARFIFHPNATYRIMNNESYFMTTH